MTIILKYIYYVFIVFSLSFSSFANVEKKHSPTCVQIINEKFNPLIRKYNFSSESSQKLEEFAERKLCSVPEGALIKKEAIILKNFKKLLNQLSNKKPTMAEATPIFSEKNELSLEKIEDTSKKNGIWPFSVD